MNQKLNKFKTETIMTPRGLIKRTLLIKKKNKNKFTGSLYY